MSVGRNDLCHCGSGRKYKKCHAEKDSRALPKGLIGLVVAIVAIAAIGIVPMVTSDERQQSRVSGSRGPVAKPGSPQPPGPPPPGKIWSVEHGHWHDAPIQTNIPVNLGAQQQGGAPASAPGLSLQQLQQQALAQQQNFKPGPQPPGPVPEGKVWSTEHGHWHDVPATTTVGATATAPATTKQ